ncbi:LmbE family N-acetylglucosaminyl deacetylase [Microbacterium sp. BE35]|uniref:bifunctional PIG-L family deacetylase/class I SAM-dependent methyltransferase n=1 Tax=Microbacterium sp. BE35 TaxID=2817773 RepID=UPI00285D62F0|nr:bifunctional PIG-L family deacetylase/class I SAM-dependent methyltransferase [Microbacterium sp. BE35]MDR7191035.1 LmbE family N-acetylglucosaminyl deacetylase [Microbacterium sp. BE35]
MSAAFSHLEAGTPESVWHDEFARRSLRPLDVQFEVLVVVAAHPDDETLGAGGLLHRAARIGARVVVVIATDGEASHPDSPTHDRDTLARLRRNEVTQAIAILAPDAEVHFLGLPDGLLNERKGHLRERLGAIFDIHRTANPRRVLVVAPWSQDRHRDHRIIAEVTSTIALHRRFTSLEYPVWAWHWGTVDDLPWDRVVALPLADDELHAKRDALACHVSQISPLSEQPGDEVLLHLGMQDHFHRDIEVFLAAEPEDAQADSLDADWFEEFYRRNGDDPWGFESRWYEQRKRALLLAALPAPELGDVFEIGCATGLLTAQLAARAREVIAMDAATAAVEAARDRLAAETRVSVRQGRIPEDWPSGRFDTIIFSEVGYYLSPADLQHTLLLIEASLADHGHVVACHWRHTVAEYPQTGDEVHEALRSVPGWETASLHVERDFVLEVFARRPARSVAEMDGLV